VGDGKTKSRQAAKQETREALLQAGMSLFSEKGVDVPSLDAICAHAGFTRGAFYVHFRDRDDFLAAVVDRVLIGFVDSMMAASQGAGDLNQTITRFLAAASQGRIPMMGQRRLMLHLMTRGVERAEQTRARFRQLLEGALVRLAAIAEASQARGTVKTEVAPDMIAALLVASALGITTLLNFGVAVDIARVQASVNELLRLEPPPP
jgi:TetR/AcrR family transcriptional regulator, transcriptional repressor for nem operon